MVEMRPFGTPRALMDASDWAWRALGPDDIRAAFAAHPRIGQSANKGGAAASWSEDEQSGVQRTGADVIRALAEMNVEYEKRFGYIFIICATGKSGEEILEALRARISNEPAAELRVAAAEQAEINHIRLEKLIAS